MIGPCRDKVPAVARNVNPSLISTNPWSRQRSLTAIFYREVHLILWFICIFNTKSFICPYCIYDTLVETLRHMDSYEPGLFATSKIVGIFIYHKPAMLLIDILFINAKNAGFFYCCQNVNCFAVQNTDKKPLDLTNKSTNEQSKESFL